MDRKFGVNSSFAFKGPERDYLPMIKEAGFTSFFSEQNGIETICDLRNEGEKLGLTLEFVHAPFSGVNDLWQAGLDYLNLYNRIKLCIDSAAAAGVDTVILHVSAGRHAPPISDIGLSRFDGLVEYAIQKNVRPAFENVRRFGNLACIMERYERVPEVGFCYDCGHELCYTETVPFLDLYHKKLCCTHLHDNPGVDKENPKLDTDTHQLPFDGKVNYTTMMQKLNEYNYTGTLMLELTKNDRYYGNMSNEEFLKTAYERLEKLSKL